MENLNRQHIICLTPEAQIQKIVRGKRIKITEALFPNYLFVKFNPEEIHTTTIRSTRGVSHFIRFGLYPVIVPDNIINELKSASKQEIVVPKTPVSGDTIIITEGIFEGLKAIYSEPDGENRSVILLNILNQNVAKLIDNKQFKKSD
ncbi:MAG: transcription/translation regulatory transformer protein RfaH [Arsenophonus sp.]|nr:transcription/translation regulatory transformer protein RfaH [Arsenophonus sp.]